jgi:hypothetical protein
MKYRLAAFALFCTITLPAIASEIACPALETAIQVATCPTEEELKYTFTGYCSDNARMYGKDTETCESYANYRKLKNIVLWESADGEFQAYLSCDLTPAAIKSAKPKRMTVSLAGKLTRVACDYGNYITFAHRTRAQCVVAGDGNCADGAGCKAACN